MDEVLNFCPAIAVPTTVKMPEPITAPMPRPVSDHGPSVFLSRCSGDNDVRMLRHGDYDAVRGAGGLGGNRRRRNVLLGTWSQLANLRDLWRRVDARRGHRADLAQGDRDVRVGHVVRAVLAGGWRSPVYPPAHGCYRYSARRQPPRAGRRWTARRLGRAHQLYRRARKWRDHGGFLFNPWRDDSSGHHLSH